MFARVLVRVFASVLCLLLLLALAGSTYAEATPPSPMLPEPASEMTGDVPAGGWIAYRLPYPGGSERVRIQLTYGLRAGHAVGQPDDQHVTLAVYGPESPPPDGKPIAWAVGKQGQQAYSLVASAGGDYVLILNNWDDRGRSLSFSMRSEALAENGDPRVGQDGPPLDFVSSSSQEEQPASTSATEQAPLPPADPIQPASEPRSKRVGIQAGHWLSAQLPEELKRLRTSTGTSGGGVPEWQLNLDVARRVAALLEAEGVAVDVLPSTIPIGYSADAFVALHADGDYTGRFSGFKLAHGRWSGNAAADKQLVEAITLEYRTATNLPTDSHISRNMTGYYAFSNRRFQHAVAPGTPAVILEMGFMTNASDLRFLLGNPDTVAQGIAKGILRFLAQE